MAFRTWGRLLLTALGVSLLAGAGQLGIAFGFGVVRLTGAFTGDTVNQWPAQLAWVGWFAANAAVVGAVLTERLARRDGLLAGTGRQLAVAGAAALGATVVAPLCMQPARAAELISVDPVWAVAICAILGAAVGAGAALAVLVRPPLGWNMALVAGAVWLLTLVSVAPSLAATGPLTTVRLGVLEPSWLGTGAAQRLAMLILPLVALLAGATTGALARWRGHPPLVGGLTGVAGPVLLAFAYLTAGPGDGIDRYQTTPYYGALLALAAGALGSAAAALLRWPLVERTAPAAGIPATGRAIEPTDILRPLPAGPALPSAATTASPTGAAAGGPGLLVDEAGTPAGAGDRAGGGTWDGGTPGATGSTSAHWDWPPTWGKPPSGASTRDTPTIAGTLAGASAEPLAEVLAGAGAAPVEGGTAAGSTSAATSVGSSGRTQREGGSHPIHPEGSATSTRSGESSESVTPEGAAGPDDGPAVAERATPAPVVASGGATPAAGGPAPRPRRGRRVKVTPAVATDATTDTDTTDEPAAGAAPAAGQPTTASPDIAPAAGSPAPDTTDDVRSDPEPPESPPAPPGPRLDPAPPAAGGVPSAPFAAAPTPVGPARPALTPVAPARPAPTPVGPDTPSRPDPTPATPPPPAPTRVGPEPFAPLPPTPLTPAQPVPRSVVSDPFAPPSPGPDDDAAASPAPRPRHRAPLPDLNSAGTWEALATARRAGPTETGPTTGTGPTETGPTTAGTGGATSGTASSGAEPKPTAAGQLAAAFAGTDGRATAGGASAVTPGQTADGDAPGPGAGPAASESADRPKRRGLFRRTRSRADQAGAPADAGPLPEQDEEFVDWVTGLSKPLPDNEPEQESGRRSLRSTGRHHHRD